MRVLTLILERHSKSQFVATKDLEGKQVHLFKKYMHLIKKKTYIQKKVNKKLFSLHLDNVHFILLDNLNTKQQRFKFLKNVFR